MKKVYTEENIDTVTSRLAHSINGDYEGKNPVIIGVLNGCYLFISDLTKKIKIDHEVDFVRIKSYHKNKSTGKVHYTKKWEIDLENRHVIVCEDTVDSGLTLDQLLPRVRFSKPASLEVVTLIKRASCQTDIKYVGITHENDDFLVGYGLDNDGKMRNLKDIYKL